MKRVLRSADDNGFFTSLKLIFEIVLVLEIVFGTRITEAEVLEAVVVGTRMKRVR